MNYGQMKPLSGKEVNYIADSVANEDMMIRMCAAASAVCTNAQLAGAISDHLRVHEQHMHMLVDALKQHQQLAPAQS
ncbi:hypothetical protein V3851_13840 [Paenibacillus sp. M1]|uniref:Spore coat protein n=1 Tax=Paenibacillus haidiansis TaxID=1574488 RepID=A0ABU7VT18_9BACL